MEKMYVRNNPLFVGCKYKKLLHLLLEVTGFMILCCSLEKGTRVKTEHRKGEDCYNTEVLNFKTKV